MLLKQFNKGSCSMQKESHYFLKKEKEFVKEGKAKEDRLTVTVSQTFDNIFFSQNFYRTQVYLGSDQWVRVSLRYVLRKNTENHYRIDALA